jgi:hypothetical protein
VPAGLIDSLAGIFSKNYFQTVRNHFSITRIKVHTERKHYRVADTGRIGWRLILRSINPDV